jgi:protein BCP1
MRSKRQAESSESDESGVISEDSISSSSASDSDSDGSNSNGPEDLINCDFEFFDPQKQDFLGIKHLLRQLLDADADEFDIDGLTELILGQPLVGSTVKTEGHEGDPLSFLTVLNLRIHKVTPMPMRTLVIGRKILRCSRC